MRVFLSWSGERSRRVAEALRDWMPLVLQSVKPWLSSHDIDAGARWNERVGVELQHSNFGVLCVTPENAHAPWLTFEAGALSKTLDAARVCPLLLGMRPSDLTGPLAQFQAVEVGQESLFKLIHSVNEHAGDGRLGDSHLVDTFGLWWPKLEPKLQDAIACLTSNDGNRQRRSVEDMVSELLDLARDQQRKALEAPRFVEIDLEEVAEEPTAADASGRPSFQRGQVVDHKQFGRGTIVASVIRPTGDEVVRVKFASVGTKQLVVKYAGLKHISARPTA